MAAEAKVLVVDDRLEVRALVSSELEEAGFRVVEAMDGRAGWRCFQDEHPDLVVTDLRMPCADGIELFRRIRSVSSVPVILLTAYGDVPTAVAAMKGGAQEFLTFPDDLDRMIARVRELVGSGFKAEHAKWLESRIAGRSPAARRVRERITALAPLKVPVLVSGEPGTGRDTIVTVLHVLGRWADTPLLPVRCGDPRASTVPVAGSAVYLDEVGRLRPDAQVTWFECLAAMERSGPQRPVRVFASTSEDLAARAREGSFHPRLSQKLLRFSIPVPPLRERKEDLDQIVPALVGRIGEAMGRDLARVSRAALAHLKSQVWLANVRELAGVVEKVVAFSARGEVTLEQVKQVLGEHPESVASMRDRRDRRRREELVVALDASGGNLAEVARRLGISRGAVIYRAKKYGLLPQSG